MKHRLYYPWLQPTLKKGTKYMSTIGDKLKSLRSERGLTQDQVAQDLGISRSAINAYELDQRTPRDEVKVRLANYYEKPIQDIFFES